jgi:hypothetical protein
MEPREIAALLPESPGVYLFKDAAGTVLYVGKAASLRSRVRSYFLESSWVNAKTGSLAREIADLETILVGNEREALALEHNLIKQYRPKFNVMLRDDKTYPYIKFTAAEKYPRVYFTRRIKKTARCILALIFPLASRAAFSISFTNVSSFQVARSTSRAAIPDLACNITFIGASALALPASPPMSAMPKPRAMFASFSKAVATTSSKV